MEITAGRGRRLDHGGYRLYWQQRYVHGREDEMADTWV